MARKSNPLIVYEVTFPRRRVALKFTSEAEAVEYAAQFPDDKPIILVCVPLSLVKATRRA